MHFHTFIIMAAFISLVGQCRGFTSRLRASRIGIAGNNNMAALRTNRYLSSSAIPKGNIGQDGDNIGQGQGEDDTWKTFSFGQFSTNVDTPNKKQRRMLQKAADIAKENEHYSDPMWDHLSDEEVEMGIAALSRYITPERKKRFDDVLQSRTSAVRIVFENPANANNCWAALRTFDSFGIQNVDVIIDPEQYHNRNKRSTMTNALGAQKWLSLRQHTTTSDCLAELKKQGYKIAVTDLHHPNAVPLSQVDWQSGKIAVILGNEQVGVTAEAREMADVHFYLPMKGFAESLNVSAFCAVLCGHMEASGALAGAPESQPGRAHWDKKKKEMKLVTDAAAAGARAGARSEKARDNRPYNSERIEVEKGTTHTEKETETETEKETETETETAVVEEEQQGSHTDSHRDRDRDRDRDMSDTERKRVMLTWMARTAPGAVTILKHEGLHTKRSGVHQRIAGFTTKP